MRVARKLQEQLVLLRREHDALAADRDPPRRAVDLDLRPRRGARPRAVRRGAARRGSARRARRSGTAGRGSRRTRGRRHAPGRPDPTRWRPSRITGTSRSHERPGSPSRSRRQSSRPSRVADQNEVGADALQEVERLSVLGPDDLEPVLARDAARESSGSPPPARSRRRALDMSIDASAGPSGAPDVLSRESVPKNRQPALTAVPARGACCRPDSSGREVQVLALPRRNDRRRPGPSRPRPARLRSRDTRLRRSGSRRRDPAHHARRDRALVPERAPGQQHLVSDERRLHNTGRCQSGGAIRSGTTISARSLPSSVATILPSQTARPCVNRAASSPRRRSRRRRGSRSTGTRRRPSPRPRTPSPRRARR